MAIVKVKLIEFSPESLNNIHSKTLEEHKQAFINALGFAETSDEIMKVLMAGMNILIEKNKH